MFMKTNWQKPTLVILIRNRPEEIILTYCKQDYPTGPQFPNTDFPGCDISPIPETCSAGCNELSPS